ncbi:MAG: TAT-variant-translocated molybdopterin oxidoreductase [Planctomycetota bacterium]|nr:TAT-variant-translocated molybdopterin oxidoreductase [Planctomycetota bacterium]
MPSMNGPYMQGYWRSLNELENSPEFAEFLHREFPVAAAEFPGGISRRRWLQLMGASLTLAGVGGCRWETEKIAAFGARPDGRIPGEPQFYATSIELAGMPRHLLVTCFDGRPIKVEGNPDHPESRGGTDVFAQAATLDLYDPDRSGQVRQRQQGRIFNRKWADFDARLGELVAEGKKSGGRGLAVLVQPTSSSTVHDLLEQLVETYPQVKIYEYAPVSRGHELTGSELAFGQRLRTHYALDQAKVIACFDADLLGSHPASIKYAHDFVAGRNPEASSIASPMSRLYAVESQFSITGAAADHRLPLRSAQIGAFLLVLDKQIQTLLSPDKKSEAGDGNAPWDEEAKRFLRVLASDLVENRGQSVLAVGPRQPAGVQALTHSINVALENVGATVRFTPEPEPACARGDLAALVERIENDEINTLLVLGGNPVYDAPADLKFGEALEKIENTIHLSCYLDETSRVCVWHLPQTHPLESWGDTLAFDGISGVSQPLIEPLLGGRSAIEILARLGGDSEVDSQKLVRGAVEKRSGSPLSERDWRRLLHDGFLANSSSKEVKPTLSGDPAVRDSRPLKTPTEAPLELVFCPSHNVFDGRFANNGWLQETPDFLTKLTWDNAAIVSPATAEELGVRHGSLIELRSGGRTVEIPVYVLPGQARGSIGVALGYGRTAAGHVGGSTADGVAPVGSNVYAIRTSQALEFTTDLEVKPTGKQVALATTQDHHAIDRIGSKGIHERIGELVREADLAEFQKPKFASEHNQHEEVPLLWQEVSYEGHAWGLSIDLTKCIGCSACVVACQAENNIPIVGKEQVARGRAMHWLRVDRYFRGDTENPQIVTQPVACHHCENAPCEQVCPVAATVHSDEGLNDMVYNRCIGTRYCANNCPYKVRRFNFFNNAKKLEQPERQLVQLAVNPEVTVRARGVMEKCTYCVQRIQRGKIAARAGRQPIADGQIKTACQQACPTQAIEFGDLNQAQSRVAQSHANSRAYAMLAELHVKPRTKYLTRIRNPHPELETT